MLQRINRDHIKIFLGKKRKKNSLKKTTQQTKIKRAREMGEGQRNKWWAGGSLIVREKWGLDKTRVRVTRHQWFTFFAWLKKEGQECFYFRQNCEIRWIFSYISVLANEGFMKLSQGCYYQFGDESQWSEVYRNVYDVKDGIVNKRSQHRGRLLRDYSM